MQETKFKIGDLLEFCTEKMQLLNNDIVYDGYGMVIDIEVGDYIDEYIYVVEMYKGVETSLNANADISGFKFRFYESQIHHDMRLLNAGNKD